MSCEFGWVGGGGGGEFEYSGGGDGDGELKVSRLATQTDMATAPQSLLLLLLILIPELLLAAAGPVPQVAGGLLQYFCCMVYIMYILNIKATVSLHLIVKFKFCGST